MLKTLAAIGISAGIALAPLGALAQTDTTAAPAATEKMAPAKSSMKKTTKHKHHMAKKKIMKKEQAPKG
jgi:hypothetical protein